MNKSIDEINDERNSRGCLYVAIYVVVTLVLLIWLAAATIIHVFDKFKLL